MAIKTDWNIPACNDDANDDGASGEDAAPESGDTVSRFYVAHVLRQGLPSDERASLQADCATAGAHTEVIPGGCYAVFSTIDDLESYSLEDAFSLLTRCAFGGWIKDNRWRVDFTRRTFVVWRDRKLHFHVPTVG